ncbi:MAG: 2-oxoglutarate dehydrogenase E1 component [Deltaproteobacteria bacterium]|nr:2-oxoglutarate dehydrogenase E1 component [Deltaproteobacteria bacterium]
MVQKPEDGRDGHGPNVDNVAYIETMYERWLDDPDAVPEGWRELFDRERHGYVEPPKIGPRFRSRSIFNPVPPLAGTPGIHARGSIHCDKHVGVLRLIDHFRARGHYYAKLDPLGKDISPSHKEPPLGQFGLHDEDLERQFLTGDFGSGGFMNLKDIRDRLRRCYCQTVGAEYQHIENAEEGEWLRRRLESTAYLDAVTPAVEVEAMDFLIRAEAFERFLHKKFVGTKRFSLEGAEALIPVLDLLVEDAAEAGVETIIIGMAHRGRINVLANILKKHFDMIFNEFEDVLDPETSFGSGDVKYHLGYNNRFVTQSGKEVWVTLTPNPSHLEAVNPVVEGRCRARIDRLGHGGDKEVLPLLIHGDAAFAGQGLVAETLNLGALRGYRTGGTVHIIINNQLGFTTSPKDARSTVYCSDVAKMLQVPIFHVNGDDVRSFLGLARLAFEYRQRFGKDAIIDFVCFRRYGHNETDEPAFTQPLMYQKIDRHPGVRKIYQDAVLERGIVTAEQVETIEKLYVDAMEDSYSASKDGQPREVKISSLQGGWSGLRVATEKDFESSVPTAIPRQLVEHLSKRLSEIPSGFNAHKKIRRLLDQRAEMGRDERPIDWGMGESLTFGSLVWENSNVRISGQDSRRGTFSHRHAVILDMDNGDEYVPLQHIKEQQGRFYACDSLLSEAGVLGFEYGYSLESPNTLVIWEAQFGDFANGAQVIIDQFIVSAEQKWKRHSGLVLLLPHGYEGQGPEHSSARLERFLMLCGDLNIQVANVTTPAQYFHLMRRQIKRDFRKPLVVMTPKSLLRHPRAVSRVDDFVLGRFRELLWDPARPDPEKVDRIVLCSGKVFYDLIGKRDEAGLSNVGILRLEQIYPFPVGQVEDILNKHPKAQVVWAQEEPANGGAWHFIADRFDECFGGRERIRRVSRPTSASPATGSVRKHLEQQQEVVEKALGLRPLEDTDCDC